MIVDRRRVLSAAALGRPPEEPGPLAFEGGEALTAVTGEVRDATPHLLVIETPAGAEERLIVAPWATAWRGSEIAPADVPVGATVVVRATRGGRIAERIWADATRVTGTIVSVTGDRDQRVELDCGPHRGRRTALIPYRVSGRLRVRHPLFEPGFLFDAIGVRGPDGAVAMLPATSQPPYRASAVPARSPAYGNGHVSGTVVWSDLFDEGERGLAYPSMERSESGCDDSGVSCGGLPYLSLGSVLTVRNVCTGRAAVVPVVACGCVAGRFCDRCVECGTSPRVRIAELSATSFVELGGDLEKGCFNARVGVG